MKNLKKIIVISSLCVTSMACAQNYGYAPHPSYGMNNPGYSNQPGQYGMNNPGYSNQPGQYQGGGYRQDGYQAGNQRYSNDQRNDQGDQGMWSGWFDGNDQKQKVPDQVITSRVMQNLRSTPYLSNAAKNIQVITRDGAVTLKGKAANENEGMQIEYMVKNVPGVTSVDNELQYQRD